MNLEDGIKLFLFTFYSSHFFDNFLPEPCHVSKISPFLPCLSFFTPKVDYSDYEVLNTSLKNINISPYVP